MTNEIFIPLEYCTPSRAARLLGCELEDIFHWYEIGAIKLFLKLDEDSEWPSGGSGFVCNSIYFDSDILGKVCYQGENGTVVDEEFIGVGNGTLHGHGTDVIFLLSDEFNTDELDTDEINKYSDICAGAVEEDDTEVDYHNVWIKLDKYDPPTIKESDTPAERQAKHESVKKFDYISYRVWTSGFHEVEIPYSYLRAGFKDGFENIVMADTISLRVNIGGSCVYVNNARIEDCESLFRVCNDDLLRIKESISSGNALNKYARNTAPPNQNIYSDVDVPVRVTERQSNAIVDLLKSLGYTPAELKGSTEALQQKITRNGHSKQLSSLTAKTLRTWLSRGDGR